MLSAAFSPDGSRIVTASWGQDRPHLGRRERQGDRGPARHDNKVYSAAFSPDGSRIVTASEDKTARIWDAASAKEIAVLRGHDSEVYSAAFSPDGSRIVTASRYRTARIWDAASVKEIAVLRHDQHDAEVYSAAFSPDGSRIVTATERTTHVWDTRLQMMPPKDLLAQVCARLAGVTKLTRDEMRLASYPDRMPEIDVCTSDQ